VGEPHPRLAPTEPTRPPTALHRAYVQTVIGAPAFQLSPASADLSTSPNVVHKKVSSVFRVSRVGSNFRELFRLLCEISECERVKEFFRLLDDATPFCASEQAVSVWKEDVYEHP
jgi:hypothetical protein